MMRSPIEGVTMTESIWPTIHAERKALADDLAGLTAEQWATQSLCSEWNVHQVLAHQLSAAKMTPPKFFLRARDEITPHLAGVSLGSRV
jgi:uncharacterized protein (TIGR03083 family)